MYRPMPAVLAASGSDGARTLPPTAIPSYYARPTDRPGPPLPRPLHVPPILDALPQPADAASKPKSLRPIDGPTPSARVDPAGPGRTHVIVDGDTLADLAARYLGDSRRSADIFAANRRVLTDPEVLPIGAALAIPPR